MGSYKSKIKTPTEFINKYGGSPQLMIDNKNIYNKIIEEMKAGKKILKSLTSKEIIG